MPRDVEVRTDIKVRVTDSIKKYFEQNIEDQTFAWNSERIGLDGILPVSILNVGRSSCFLWNFH